MSDAFSDRLGGHELTDTERDQYVLDNVDTLLADYQQAVVDRDQLKLALKGAVEALDRLVSWTCTTDVRTGEREYYNAKRVLESIG